VNFLYIPVKTIFFFNAILCFTYIMANKKMLVSADEKWREFENVIGKSGETGSCVCSLHMSSMSLRCVFASRIGCENKNIQ
jgi:hypothetical protein